MSKKAKSYNYNSKKALNLQGFSLFYTFFLGEFYDYFS